jgi:EAL domain-containing protein (putative c-di-GMP-specific phosphodiesterase class I)
MYLQAPATLTGDKPVLRGRANREMTSDGRQLSGLSNRAYLKRIPADALKIDRTFLAGLGEDVEDTAIVQMIVDLAHTFGMEVIAEGVESQEHVEQLKEMGCDLGQGFYFAEPQAPDAASEFLAR